MCTSMTSIQRDLPAYLFPDLARQHLTGNHPALVPHKIFKDFKFTRGQLQKFLATSGRAAHDIHLKIGGLQLSGRFLFASAKQHANTGKQLGECEWLDEVIVRADIEASDAVFNSIAGGQKQYRGTYTLLSQRRQNIKAIPAREHYVQNDEIEWMAPQQVESILARLHRFYGIAVGLEPLA